MTGREALRGLRSLLARCRALLLRRRLDRELDEELRFHLEQQEAEYLRRGLSREEAGRAARRRLGGVERVKETCRRQRGLPGIESLLQDLGFGLRMMRRSPLVTAVAFASLALGLGASGAIFNVLDSVLLAPLPGVDHPGGMVVLSQIRKAETQNRFTYAAFRQLEREVGSLAGLLAFTPPRSFLTRVLAAPGGARAEAAAEWADGQLVSGSFFPVLGVKARLGRLLSPADDRMAGGHPVVVISDRFWRRRFAGAREALGRAVEINGLPCTVIGVSPPGFFGVVVGESPDLFLPTALQSPVHYQGHFDAYTDADPSQPWIGQPRIAWLQLMGRLAPGATPVRAGAEATVVLRRFAAAMVRPEDLPAARGLRVVLAPGAEGVSNLRRRFSLALLILSCAAGLLLLIACCNTANLLLARSAARRKEIAVRLSQGAGRARLVRQLLTESLLLALASGMAGLALAHWGSGMLLRIATSGASSLDLSLDWHRIGFLAAASVATALLFGMAPALQATRFDLASSLKEGSRSLPGRGPAAGRARLPLGKALVVAEVGLSLVLLVGAGLFVRSLQNLHRLDPGFEPRGLLLVRIHPQVVGLDPRRLLALEERLQERLSALPGVRSASLSGYTLVSGSVSVDSVAVEGFNTAPGENPEVQDLVVTPRYFATMGMKLLEGREFTSRDAAGAPRVAVINEAMARRFFHQRPPLGRRFGFGDAPRAHDIEVVGVVRDARYNDLRQESVPMAFVPAAQSLDPLGEIEILTDPGAELALDSEVRQVVREVAPVLPLGSVRTMEEQLQRSLGEQNAVSRLTTSFALVALLLSAIGLYGVLSYAVARRRNEIGLRLALGAQRFQVLELVLRETLWLVAAGVAIGLGGALAATRLASSWLYGVTASDPPTLGASILGLAIVAAAAGYLPARRAAAVEPLTALRSGD
jgi:predicted permease